MNFLGFRLETQQSLSALLIVSNFLPMLFFQFSKSTGCFYLRVHRALPKRRGRQSGSENKLGAIIARSVPMWIHPNHLCPTSTS